MNLGTEVKFIRLQTGCSDNEQSEGDILNSAGKIHTVLRWANNLGAARIRIRSSLRH